jgi:RNA polymerase sigma factor (sigma-70 family)
MEMESEAGFDDWELVRTAQQGAPGEVRTALAVLYDRYDSLLRRGIRKKVNSDWDASEIAAETWARVVCRIHLYEQRSTPLLSWLFGIANRVMLEQCRRTREHSFDDQTEASWSRRSGASPLPGEELDCNQSRSTDLANSTAGNPKLPVLDALASLPPLERRIIVLRYFENCESLKEVATHLQKNQSTVRVYHQRALHKMKCYLEARAAGT